MLLRYTGFKENDVYSPNSYEPTVLRDNQQLLEIVPMALFAAHVARTKNNLVRFFNSAMQNGYREDCLGWRRQNTETLTRFSIERDDDDDYKTPEREASKVIISYTSGRVSTQIESTPVIYRKGNQTVAGRLVEIIDDPSVSELQLVDEISVFLDRNDRNAAVFRQQGQFQGFLDETAVT